MGEAIKIGISSCLLGNRVRYDGEHQLDRFITETLGKYFVFVPVCPEAECGLGVPREPMHLFGDPEKPRLVTRKTGRDLTERMVNWSKKKVKELEEENLHGFIFKSRSPSSGMERVKVYGPDKKVTRNGVGMFAREFMRHFPLLPVEEDGRLHDVRLRENFIERMFAYNRWRSLLSGKKTRGELVGFHTTHKLQILSHSEIHYRAMGRLVAHGQEKPIGMLYAEYEKLLVAALQLKTTVKKNINVLLHILGYFKKQLSAEEKKEMLEVIDQYRNGYVPLIVPITLVNHYVRKYEVQYLAGQFYLHPHPLDLKLRNHA